MPAELREFICQYLGAVGATLVPVILTAFVSMPLILGAHPGEAPVAQAGVARHLC